MCPVPNTTHMTTCDRWRCCRHAGLRAVAHNPESSAPLPACWAFLAPLPPSSPVTGWLRVAGPAGKCEAHTQLVAASARRCGISFLAAALRIQGLEQARTRCHFITCKAAWLVIMRGSRRPYAVAGACSWGHPRGTGLGSSTVGRPARCMACATAMAGAMQRSPPLEGAARRRAAGVQ